MTKITRKLFLGLLGLALIIPFTFPPSASAAETEFKVNAKAGFAVDFETGKVLYDQAGETPMGIASITKILSLYIVEKQIQEGQLKWEDQVEISDYAAELSVHPDLSNVPLHKENKYTVKELFDASVIQSANAAVVALGEKIAGSEVKFVDMMKAQLAEWGIKDATIVNASGLNNSYLGSHIYPDSAKNAENLMSAKDVAIVARHLLQDFPDVLEVSKTTTKMFGANTQSPVEMVNWNWMLKGFINAKDGVDGLKTGTTDLAGACFVGTMVKDNQRIITVVLNAADHKNDPSARFVETAKLMDYSYDNWSQETVTKAGATIPELKTIGVNEGKELKTTVALEQPVTLWVRKGMNTEELEIQPTLDKKVIKDGQVQAPVDKGTAIGEAAVALKEDNLGYLDANQQPKTKIVITKSMEKANFFVLIGRNISSFFSNLF